MKKYCLEYEQKMTCCQNCGIIRKNGFLYLKDSREIKFRRQGDIERSISQIAPEEPAAAYWKYLNRM